MNGNRKLLWKEVCNAIGGKVESCSKIKDGNGRLVQGENEVRKFGKDCFEDLYNIHARGQVGVHMRGFDGIRRGNYFGKLKNRKAVEMIKGGW